MASKMLLVLVVAAISEALNPSDLKLRPFMPGPPAAPPSSSGSDEHGLPALPSGETLDLKAPGWAMGMGTGGRVWPAAGALCRYLAAADVCRDQRVLELGCGTGAVGVFCAAGLGPKSVVLTEGGSIGLRAVAARNVEVNRPLYFENTPVHIEKHSWGAEDLLKAPCDLVVGSDVTYDRDAHGDLCASLAALLNVTEGSAAILAHQHRKLASVLSGEGQLAHFLECAEEADLAVEEVAVDERNPAAPVSLLRITPK